MLSNYVLFDILLTFFRNLEYIACACDIEARGFPLSGVAWNWPIRLPSCQTSSRPEHDCTGHLYPSMNTANSIPICVAYFFSFDLGMLQIVITFVMRLLINFTSVEILILHFTMQMYIYDFTSIYILLRFLIKRDEFIIISA